MHELAQWKASQLPEHNHEGVLPPFMGDPAARGARSPYRATFQQLVETLGWTQERVALLRNLTKYRQRLFQFGIKSGVQLINGSFTQRMNREPNDIDVLTIFKRANISDQNFLTAVRHNISLFDRDRIKREFKLDLFFIDVSASTYYSYYRSIAYWTGLFSHRREDFIWKGIVEIKLQESIDDFSMESLMIDSVMEELDA